MKSATLRLQNKEAMSPARTDSHAAEWSWLTCFYAEQLASRVPASDQLGSCHLRIREPQGCCTATSGTRRPGGLQNRDRRPGMAADSERSYSWRQRQFKH